MRMNKVFFSGRLCRDPDSRRTGGGDPVVNVTLAQETKRKGSNGDWVDGEPIFVDVIVWGARGEAFAKHHKKGDMAVVEGRLRLDLWDDKTTGARRSKIRVDCNEWHFANTTARAVPEMPEDGIPF